MDTGTNFYNQKPNTTWILAHVLAYLKIAGCVHLEDTNFRLGVQTGIDFYLHLINKYNLMGIRKNVVERMEEISKDLDNILLERMQDFRSEKRNKDKELLLSGEHAFYAWLIGLKVEKD